ncbi:MAG: hypothetical protein CXT72_07305 [Methanobacteriota archaeon]|nr:MAG: hypothetical protein CXT72_07305 [Euryarchaeota archaeon]
MLLLTGPAGMVAANDHSSDRECTIFVDWGRGDLISIPNENGDILHAEWELIHRYRVEFEPAFSNGSSPNEVNVTLLHQRGEIIVGDSNSSDILIAGGEIDITLAEDPEFGDEIEIAVMTEDAICSRELRITNWNQPIADHEITRTTTWSSGLADSSDDGERTSYVQLEFNGRGWQQRIGSTLISNELSIQLYLELDKVWLNETYFDQELLNQEFEMVGNGSMFFTENNSQSIAVQIDVTDALYNRTLANDDLSEHLLLNGNGSINFNSGDDNESMTGSGIVPVFFFEYEDYNGERTLQDTELIAQMTLQIQMGDGDYAELELEEFRMNDKWVYGVQEERLLKYVGEGEFGFVASESQPYIVVNGTIDNVHYEDRNGLIIADTIRINGEYNGDASGTFGMVRFIDERTTEQNASGNYFEVNKIYNEYWFNVSATPIGPIDQEFQAEHNLTFEYTVPQADWDSPTIRYEYVEENGTNDEYPEYSPIPSESDPPISSSANATPITRESGAAPEILIEGDTFWLLENEINLHVFAESVGSSTVDGHQVVVMNWRGQYGGNSMANGTVINEGILAGLVDEVRRVITINDMVGSYLVENQTLERIHLPLIITSDENTEPKLIELRFREGVLYAEGGLAHLEAVIEDVDADVQQVEVDLTTYGLGIVQLSDRGLFGDLVIHDDIWTAAIEATGLVYGTENVEVEIRDYWAQVSEIAVLRIENPAPRMVSLQFSPSVVYRGDSVSISVQAIDGHGIASISVDLLGFGGEVISLIQSDAEISPPIWEGEFTVANGMIPGDMFLPIRLTDLDGASRLSHSIIMDGNLVDAPQLTILNEAPIVDTISIYRNGEVRENIAVPEYGSPISQLIEVLIDDPDGISSVQAKIGRLAPIGQSEQWLLMVDDGTGGDRIASDGIYTLSVDARSSLPEGEMTILIRGTDIYLSTTAEEDPETSSTFWTAKMTTALIWGVLILLTMLAITGIVITLKNSELE